MDYGKNGLEKTKEKELLGTKPVGKDSVVKDELSKGKLIGESSKTMSQSDDLSEDELAIMTTKQLYEMYEGEAKKRVVNRVEKGYTVDDLEKDAKRVFTEISMVEMRTGVLVSMLKEAAVFKGKYKALKYQEVRALAGSKKRGFDLDTRDGVSWIIMKV